MGFNENVSSVRKPVGDIVLKATHYIKNQLLSSLLSCQAQYIYQESKLLAPAVCLLNWFKLVCGLFGQRNMHCPLDFYQDQPGKNQMYQN